METITENMREAEMRPSIGFHVAPKHFIPTEDIDCEIISDDDEKESSLMMVDESFERYMKRGN
jgi:hypothetical protein